MGDAASGARWHWLPRALGPVAATLSARSARCSAPWRAYFLSCTDARALVKDAFRATMSAMLLTLSLVRGIGYYAVGEFTRDA